MNLHYSQINQHFVHNSDHQTNLCLNFSLNCSPLHLFHFKILSYSNFDFTILTNLIATLQIIILIKAIFLILIILVINLIFITLSVPLLIFFFLLLPVTTIIFLLIIVIFHLQLILLFSKLLP